MIWKLLQIAEKNFRTLKGYWLLPDVYYGKSFVDGVVKQKIMETARMAVGWLFTHLLAGSKRKWNYPRSAAQRDQTLA